MVNKKVSASDETQMMKIMNMIIMKKMIKKRRREKRFIHRAYLYHFMLLPLAGGNPHQEPG